MPRESRGRAMVVGSLAQYFTHTPMLFCTTLSHHLAPPYCLENQETLTPCRGIQKDTPHGTFASDPWTWRVLVRVVVMRVGLGTLHARGNNAAQTPPPTQCHDRAGAGKVSRVWANRVPIGYIVPFPQMAPLPPFVSCAPVPQNIDPP